MKNKRKFFVRFVAISLLLVIILFLYTRFFEPEWLEIKYVSVDLFDKGDESKSVRILHATDFHLSEHVSLEYINKAIMQGIALKPDLIILTGDYVTGWFDESYVGSSEYNEYRKVLEKLIQSAPTYACLGNHDGGVWAEYDSKIFKQLIRESGIDLLDNEQRNIEINGQQLTLIGLGDLWAEEFDPVKAFENLSIDNNNVKVVVVHNPDAKDKLEEYPWDLLLAGHTHGGQLNLPFIGTPFAPVIDQDYVAGLKFWKDRWIHVSKGVGNVGGVRFNARPDITLIEIKNSGPHT